MISYMTRLEVTRGLGQGEGMIIYRYHYIRDIRVMALIDFNKNIFIIFPVILPSELPHCTLTDIDPSLSITCKTEYNET